MADDIAIQVDAVSKTFKLPHERTTSIKGLVVNFWRRKRGYEKQRVLHNVSFTVKKGEFFGIVGRNGSGKSTLLKMLAGIYIPDKGGIHVHGRLTPFIELGVGFNPELTGRENVFLNGALLGFNRKEVAGMYDDIVAFAELERFMDQKLKNYSSGMQVRLAFSIAIRAKGDILLLDEVLAVGDAAFQKKCYDYFASLKENKKTLILVTHDMTAVRQYCDRAIMIDAGIIVESGSPDKVSQSYQRLFIEQQADGEYHPISGDSWGEGGITITTSKVTVGKDTIHLRTTFTADAALPAPIYGFTLYNQQGLNLLESNTLRLNYKTSPLIKGQTVVLDWQLPNVFRTGKYKISVACCDKSATHFYQWLNAAAVFEVTKDAITAGAIDPPVMIKAYEPKGL